VLGSKAGLGGGAQGVTRIRQLLLPVSIHFSNPGGWEGRTRYGRAGVQLLVFCMGTWGISLGEAKTEKIVNCRPEIPQQPGTPLPISPRWLECTHKEMWVPEVNLFKQCRSDAATKEDGLCLEIKDARQVESHQEQVYFLAIVCCQPTGLYCYHLHHISIQCYRMMACFARDAACIRPVRLWGGLQGCGRDHSDS
jgi:hypothetical protein